MQTLGLADASNTRTDTSARIHTVCKVAGDFYASLEDPNKLVTNKLDYQVLQGELLLCVGNQYKDTTANSVMQAYPRVLSNVRPLQEPNNAAGGLEQWYVTLWDTRTWRELEEQLGKSCKVKGRNYFPMELSFFGVCMSSRAHASEMVGDNACTSMVGGKITVRNGNYPITVNTPVMWYIHAEAVNFDQYGNRKNRAAVAAAAAAAAVPGGPPNPPAMAVQMTHDYGERADTKWVVYPKPAVRGIANAWMSIIDEKRVFGVALSNAGPGGNVDILLGRPSF